MRSTRVHLLERACARLVLAAVGFGALACVACVGRAPSSTVRDGGVLASVDSGVAGDVDAGSRDAGASDAGASDAGASDAGASDAGANDVDGGIGCSIDGNLGVCIATESCEAADAGNQSTPGFCPGAADIECCAPIPNVANNPPVPAGYQLMQQSQVTPDMTSWAVSILHDPTDYPMFATATMMFGAQLVLARVEWHPPDFNNNEVHRGVTLYVPTT